MGYQSALEAAGAHVLSFECFGDYQGTWLAQVFYNGEVGWVVGGYGSCDDCDAFRAEFGWKDPACDAHQYNSEDFPDCAECLEEMKAYKRHLKNFGEHYLRNLHTTEELIQSKSEDSEWDMGAEEVVAYLKSHPLPTVQSILEKFLN